MSPYHTTTNAAVFTAFKSYVIITVTNSTAKVTINKLKNTQLQHKAGISSTLSEILYTYTHEHHNLCSFYGHRATTGTQSHVNNTHTHTHTYTLYESDHISPPHTSDRPQHFRYMHVTTARNEH